MTITGNWAAILAGGEGQRLRSFTKVLTGDDRPKQFCRLFGTRTLLAETRHRVFQNVEAARTLYVVNHSHRPFYQPELPDTPGWRMVEQPSNRGTTPAVMYTLSRLRALRADGVVGFFPADHYFRNAETFRKTITTAYALAHALAHSVVLVGAEANRPETEYGWIEPGSAIEAARLMAGAHRVHTVLRFCEKPEESVAVDLMARGCLWNTFIAIGRVGAFERMIAESVPDLWDEFVPMRRAGSRTEEQQIARRVYANIASSDFSRDVLSVDAARLVVVTLPESGWTDLGQPWRVLTVLSERGEAHVARRVAAG